MDDDVDCDSDDDDDVDVDVNTDFVVGADADSTLLLTLTLALTLTVTLKLHRLVWRERMAWVILGEHVGHSWGILEAPWGNSREGKIQCSSVHACG